MNTFQKDDCNLLFLPSM